MTVCCSSEHRILGCTKTKIRKVPKMWFLCQPQWMTHFHFQGLIFKCTIWAMKTAFQIKILKSQDLENPVSSLPCFIIPITSHPHPLIHPFPHLPDREESSPRPTRVLLYKQSGKWKGIPTWPAPIPIFQEWKDTWKNGLTVWQSRKARRWWRNSMALIISTHAKWTETSDISRRGTTLKPWCLCSPKTF